MSEAEIEETTMLLRAQLASKKGVTTLRELTREYYELNGENIPFRKFGFSNLADFLASHRDMFHLANDPMTNELCVKPVIDSDMAALHRLVSGQKSKKKKKNAAPKPVFRFNKKPVFVQHRFPLTSNYHQANRPKLTAYNVFRHSNPNQSNSNHINYPAKNMGSNISPSGNWMTPSQFNQPDPTPKTNLFSPTRSVQSVRSNGSLPDSKPALDIQSLFITNASYFLKEHNVVVTHIESCHRFYVRLEGGDFDRDFKGLTQRMNAFYPQNAKNLKLTEYEQDKVCVAQDSNLFYRVQIKKVSVDQAECYFLDEGRTVLLNKSSLFLIKNDFLNVQFQAIQVNISGFDKFFPNLYLHKCMEETFLKKKFHAKRVSVSPLTVNLYDQNNKSVSDEFVNNKSFCCQFKPSQGERFSTCISYLSDDTPDLVYLQNPNGIELFVDKMNEINVYYQDLETRPELKQMLNQTTRRRLAEFKGTTFNSKNPPLFCAKWELDGRWYRARFIRELGNGFDKAFVLFVDFGNRELVDLKDLLIIPEKFALFASLPFQCFQATIENMPDELKETWTDGYFGDFEIIRVNSAGVPELRFHPSAELKPKSPVVDDDVDKKLAQQMNQLEINDEEKAWRQVEIAKPEDPDQMVTDVAYSSLRSSDLPVRAQVNVRTINNPTDFIITLAQHQHEYDKLLQEMKKFYLNSTNYKAANFTKDNIYVARRSDFVFVRVRLISTLSDNKKLKFYDIDAGSYDIYDTESVYYITNRFLKLKPLAIRAQLAGIKCDREDRWSPQSRAFFQMQVMNNPTKTFEAKMKMFDAAADFFKIDLLFDNKSINEEMLRNGLASKC